jgi:hypothetical protein
MNVGADKIGEGTYRVLAVNGDNISTEWTVMGVVEKQDITISGDTITIGNKAQPGAGMVFKRVDAK